jgi:hypothetical protein
MDYSTASQRGRRNACKMDLSRQGINIFWESFKVVFKSSQVGTQLFPPKRREIECFTKTFELI